MGQYWTYLHTLKDDTPSGPVAFFTFNLIQIFSSISFWLILMLVIVATDVYYAWNLLFTELCNEHAPLK